jgi:hypothetical protein
MATENAKEDRDALDALELEAKEFDKVSCEAISCPICANP